MPPPIIRRAPLRKTVSVRVDLPGRDPQPGAVAHLSGALVDAKRDDGAWIHTSLTRLDQGAGACEVLLVRGVQSE